MQKYIHGTTTKGNESKMGSWKDSRLKTKGVWIKYRLSLIKKIHSEQNVKFLNKDSCITDFHFSIKLQHTLAQHRCVLVYLFIKPFLVCCVFKNKQKGSQMMTNICTI